MDTKEFLNYWRNTIKLTILSKLICKYIMILNKNFIAILKMKLGKITITPNGRIRTEDSQDNLKKKNVIAFVLLAIKTNF